MKVRASARIAKGAERVAQSHTGLSLVFDHMDLVLGGVVEEEKVVSSSRKEKGK